jgi:hypothetical protein
LCKQPEAVLSTAAFSTANAAPRQNANLLRLRWFYAANRVGPTTEGPARRVAKVTPNRVMPLMTRLMPTRTPITHPALEGHCM